MPTYEYKCEACGHRFEKFQSMSAAPIRKCPKCGKARVRRLIGTGAGLIFKGSGFYITDYRDSAYKESAKADSGGTSSDGKSETKADAKADKKSDAKAEAKSDSKTESTSTSEPKTRAAPKNPEKRGKKK